MPPRAGARPGRDDRVGARRAPGPRDSGPVRTASRSIGARPRPARRGDRPRRDRAATSPRPTMCWPVRSAHPSARSRPAPPRGRNAPPRCHRPPTNRRSPETSTTRRTADRRGGRSARQRAGRAARMPRIAPARTRCWRPPDGRGRAPRRCRRCPLATRACRSGASVRPHVSSGTEATMRRASRYRPRES